MAISQHFGSSSSADHDNEDTEVYGTTLDTNNVRALTRSADVWDCFVFYSFILFPFLQLIPFLETKACVSVSRHECVHNAHSPWSSLLICSTINTFIWSRQCGPPSPPALSLETKQTWPVNKLRQSTSQISDLRHTDQGSPIKIFSLFGMVKVCSSNPAMHRVPRPAYYCKLNWI